jgi:hypothetical protein
MRQRLTPIETTDAAQLGHVVGDHVRNRPADEQRAFMKALGPMKCQRPKPWHLLALAISILALAAVRYWTGAV